jgi:hypothetical protein
MAFQTDEILWYNVGEWGKLGYAVPNFGNDVSTLNSNIAYLAEAMGRNLQAVMLHRDADLTVPPTINTLQRVHKLCTRARQILAARAVSPATQRLEPVHATPAREDFLIFPLPFFKVRNRWLKEWAGLILNAIGEACQHTENAHEYEISTDFAGLIGQYVQRVYVRMATELFQVPVSEASAPTFTLTETHLKSYDPSKFFTSTELIDTPPAFDSIPTEDDLTVLTGGIPASMLVGLTTYPRGNGQNATTIPAPASPAFIAPPSP